MSHETAMATAYAEALRGTWLSIYVNLALGAAKIAAGVLGGCFALVSDGLHSLADLATSLGTVVGLRISRRPPDAQHPYGHSRAEAIVGAYVSLGLAAGGAWVGIKAVSLLGEPHGIPAGYTLWVAAAGVAVKEALFQYKIRLGRRLASRSLMADAWDHRSDALSGLAVVAGVALTRFAGWYSADDVASLIVAATLLWAAVALLRDATNELMDAQQDAGMVDALRRQARSVPGVHDVETLWVRKAGLEYLVDVHIEVDPAMSVQASHAVAHEVQDRLRAAVPAIHCVLVHVEPHAAAAAAGGASAGAARRE